MMLIIKKLISPIRKVKRIIYPKWFYEIPKIKEKASKCQSLQLGSGLATKIPGCINVDINEEVKPDVIFDLNQKINVPT